jgi:hypothetical protein
LAELGLFPVFQEACGIRERGEGLGRGWEQVGGFWEFLGSGPGDHCPGGKDRAAKDRGLLEEGSASNRSHSWNLHS